MKAKGVPKDWISLSE